MLEMETIPFFSPTSIPPAECNSVNKEMNLRVDVKIIISHVIMFR
jgi:hypothetical protein